MASDQDKRDQILLAALEHVPFDGWTEAVLIRSAKDKGFSVPECTILFQGGIASLVDHFSAYADRKMCEAFAQEQGKVKGVGRKVALAVRLRFKAVEEHREAVRKMLAFYALPFRFPRGAHRLYETADTIWSLVGVSSADFSFYTRRATLAGILTGTTFFWLADETEGNQASWTFLDNRIADTGKIAQLKQKFSRL